MLCDNCGSQEAAVHLTKIENNEMKTSHLCQACAAEQGVGGEDAAPVSAPLTDFLAQLGKGFSKETPTVGACPACGFSTTQLRQTGRLGCAECYQHFGGHLRGLLRRLHGGTQHVGKTLQAVEQSGPESRAARVQALRRSLERAVHSEDFEHAAVLRDQIRRLETAP